LRENYGRCAVLTHSKGMLSAGMTHLQFEIFKDEQQYSKIG